MRSWLQDNDTEMYSIHNEGKSVVAERFIRNVYIEKLADTVNKQINTYQNTIKMMPLDVKSSKYTDFDQRFR